MILDTNAVSDLLAGSPALAAVLAESDRHHLPVIVLGEYRYGLLGSRHRRQLERLLDTLERGSYLLAPDRDTAVHYALIRRQLRTEGHPLPENDIWIAALAKQHELPVASRDAHFDHIQGIRRIGWQDR